MAYFDTELEEAYAWFAVNWDLWRPLNTEITNGLGNVFDNTTGPAGSHKEPYWQWVRDNRADLLDLYNSLKN